jgi:hypothetical protein
MEGNKTKLNKKKSYNEKRRLVDLRKKTAREKENLWQQFETVMFLLSAWPHRNIAHAEWIFRVIAQNFQSSLLKRFIK